MKYGLILGRFQPFHIAHESIIHEVMNDGLEPIIILGSANVINDSNPYTVRQRATMIQKVFPEIVVVPTDDNMEDWDIWHEGLLKNIKLDKSQIVWYINNKESDRTYFKFNGKLYNNQFYTQIFKDLGYETKEATYPSKLNLSISATGIRDNLEESKHYLDARVYKYIKELQDGKNQLSYYK